MGTSGMRDVEELVGRRGDTHVDASTELSRLQLWLVGGHSPLLPEIRQTAAPFLGAQGEGVPGPQSPLSFLPWGAELRVLNLHLPRGQPFAHGPGTQLQGESQTHLLPLLLLFPPCSPFPAATGDESPSSLPPSLPPSLTCLESWRQKGTHRAWKGFSGTKARRHQGTYF